jgi:hypothetical protein
MDVWRIDRDEFGAELRANRAKFWSGPSANQFGHLMAEFRRIGSSDFGNGA